MLQIRQQQIRTLEQESVRRFEDETFAHLRATFPRQIVSIGEQRSRSVIRLGISRAAVYGIDGSNDLRNWIELMLLLGSEFDTDPQLPWASRFLHDSQMTVPAVRMDALFEKAIDYAGQVLGPNDIYFGDALRRIRAEATTVQLLPAGARPSFADAAAWEADILQRLGAIYPQKVAYVGRGPLGGLVAAALEAAGSQGLANEQSAMTFAGMMLLLGHGFYRDPQHAWAAEALREDEGRGAQSASEALLTRQQRLVATALAQADRCLAAAASASKSPARVDRRE